MGACALVLWMLTWVESESNFENSRVGRRLDMPKGGLPPYTNWGVCGSEMGEWRWI